MATLEICGAVMDNLQTAERAMRGAVDSLRRAVALLRENPILGQDPEQLATLAVVTDANRTAVARLQESLKHVLKSS